MADSTKGVLEFLEQLRRDRDELNVLIAGIEKRIGISPRPAHAASESHNIPVQPPKVKVMMGEIPLGFFHNMSQPGAAEKLLRLNPGQPLTTHEMLDAFRKSGLHLNPKNATTILYTALSRSPKFERVAGKAWGLAEWYSNGKKKTDAKRKTEDDLSHINVGDDADDEQDELIVGVITPAPDPKTEW